MLQGKSNSQDYIDHIFLGNSESLEQIPDSVVHLTVTSPPYWNAIDYRSHITDPTLNFRNRKTSESYQSYLAFLSRSFKEVYRVHRRGSVVAVVIGTILHDGEHIPLPFHLVRLMEKIGYEFLQDIIWHKCTAGVKRAGSVIQKPYPGYYYPNIMTEYILLFKKPGPKIYRRKNAAEREQSKIDIDSVFTRDIANNIWNIAPVPPRTVDHPCPFPEEIPERLIRLYTYVGDLVLDPFAGSGTTLKVAHFLGRHFVGYEIEEKYVRVAKRSISEPSKIRKEQLVVEFKKVKRGEKIPPKNAKQRRYRKGPPVKEKEPLLFK